MIDIFRVYTFFPEFRVLQVFILVISQEFFNIFTDKGWFLLLG